MKSCEGTTQGDPAAIAIYAIAIIPLLLTSRSSRATTWKENQISCLRRQLYRCWLNHKSVTLVENPHRIEPTIGYHPEPTKCWLIVKPRMKDIALKTFKNTDINTTKDGRRHLGAVIGSIEYRENYVTQKVNT